LIALWQAHETAKCASRRIAASAEGATADGFETQFGTNHLGHFVFDRCGADPTRASDGEQLNRLTKCQAIFLYSPSDSR
jgi:hypothetical protein